MKNREIEVINKKIRDLDIQIKYTEDINPIDKRALEIDLLGLLIKKAKLKGDIESALKYKKLKLKKEIEYIELYEAEQSLVTMTLNDFLAKSYDKIEYIRTNIDAFDFNFKNEDEAVGGVPIGAMIQFAAKSGAGKTSTLMRIALNMSRNGEKVVHFNFEMSEMLLHKTYTNIIGDNREFFKNSLENLILLETPSEKLEDIIRDIKILHYRQEIRMFIIDSRMKIKVENAFNSKESATIISHELSKLVRNLGITIILINQLSEESIKENRIVLKESGDQEYDADIIIGLGFVYERDGNGKIIKDEQTNQLKYFEDKRILICKKNRFGKPFIKGYEISINEIFMPLVKEITPDISDNDNENNNNKINKQDEKVNKIIDNEDNKDDFVKELSREIGLINSGNINENETEIIIDDNDFNVDNIDIPWGDEK